MKGIYEVLRQREAAVAHLHKEIESLKIVGPYYSPTDCL